MATPSVRGLRPPLPKDATPPAHSPAPWLYHPAVLDVTDAEGFSIVEMYDQGPREVTRANGYIIAAAPDLLEACYAALELKCPDGDDHECGVIERINNAIAKAEGRS